jgi:HAMP domain-containing protein
MWVGWPLSGLRALGILVGTKLASAGVVLLRVERGLERASAGLAAIRARLDA